VENIPVARQHVHFLGRYLFLGKPTAKSTWRRFLADVAL
jgi:hypothetical protein